MKFKCLQGEAVFTFKDQKHTAIGGVFSTEDKAMCDFLSQNRNFEVVKEEVVEKAADSADKKVKKAADSADKKVKKAADGADA